MIVRHVLIGGLFTLAGIVSLAIPAIPFICIGALVWGPIEMMMGLLGTEGARRAAAAAPPEIPPQPIRAASPVRICPSCGAQVETFRMFCLNCGTRLP